MHRLLFIAGLVTVALVSAEVTARIEDFVRWGIPVTAVPDRPRDLTMHVGTYVRGRPNGRFERWHLNAYGFRSPPMALTPRTDCPRIMVMGASETFGLYESDGHEFPAQLADRLRQRGCVEVVNAAVAGLSVSGLIDLWTNWGVRFAPSVVILYPTPSFYLSTTPPGSDPPRADGTPPPWWTPRLVDHLHDVMHYPDVIQRERVRRWIASDTAGRPSSWFFRTVPDDRAALFERDLERFVTAVEQGGAIPVLVTHAVPFAGAPAPDQEALMEAWRRYYPRATTPTLLAFDSASAAIVRRVGAERGVPVVDAAGALNGQRAVFADFTHFTDSGAGRMADLLAAQVTATEARR